MTFQINKLKNLSFYRKGRYRSFINMSSFSVRLDMFLKILSNLLLCMSNCVFSSKQLSEYKAAANDTMWYVKL